MNGSPLTIEQQLAQCLLADRFALGKLLQKINALRQASKPVDKLQAELERRLLASCAQVQLRREKLPFVSFPEDLPISQKRDDIAAAIRDNQVVIVAGETGSGKTTQIPKICLTLGQGIFGTIGHTQPRRIAARTVASRIAEELRVPLGESVGYQVRFSDQSQPHSHIKLMTDGILLAEIQNDRFLTRYDTLIIDEAHERSLNIDFLLGYLKQLLPKRPDLKVIVTSATIDVERLSKHFSNAPIVQVSGRTFPVEVAYRPPFEEDSDATQLIVDTLTELVTGNEIPGDVLIFLAGERDIRETAQAIRKAQLPHVEITPLYARLSLAEQAKVFQPHSGIRVVLATNVAETSLTVPGIRYVIDPGTARISRYSYRTKIQRLPIEPISQASANQRKGRSGRVAAGVCIRLYSEADFMGRPEFTEPEILRSNLASVILQMANLQLGHINDFPFVDQPDTRLVNDGYRLLEELHAIDRQEKLTAIGKQLTQLPVDPRLGRMCIAAAHNGCLQEVLIIVSALSIQDPRERPAEKQQAADEKHRRFWDEGSDFLSLVKLWHYLEEQRQALSQNSFARQCKTEFLSYLRVREWRDLHHQLRLATQHLQLRENPNPASYEQVHNALLTGLLGNLGMLDEERQYQGTRNRKFSIFPGSSQFKKLPKWVAAAELLETSKLYAHCVAKVEPEWVLRVAEHLVKRHQYEPHYDAQRGQVLAYERITLYGLILEEKRRVNYSEINPDAARDIFIQAALVEGRYVKSLQRNAKTPAFWQHNQALLADVHELEAKSRRRDILVDERTIFQFYAERLPEKIANITSFETWRKQHERDQPGCLFLTRELLMQHAAQDITEAQFPNNITWNNITYQLSYYFEPGSLNDGVSVHVPIHALHLIEPQWLDWLVPGMLREKCVQLVKGLPKQWRKHFVPVPDQVDKALAILVKDYTKPLWEMLGQALLKSSGVKVPTESWQAASVDPYYRFNIHVIDERNKVIESGRDLALLRESYRDRLQETLRQVGDAFERTGLIQWDFSELPASYNLKRQGVTTIAFPALIDRREHVDLLLLDDATEAERSSERGVVRLGLLAMRVTTKYLEKNLLVGKNSRLQLALLGNHTELVDDLICAAALPIVLAVGLPRTHAVFEQCVAKMQQQLTGAAQELSKKILQMADERLVIQTLLQARENKPFFKPVYEDITTQLTQLFAPGFIYSTPVDCLSQYSRYLQAIKVRIEKTDAQIQKDIAQLALLRPYLVLYQQATGDPKHLAKRSAALRELRWMLEEYRVSLFAQPMKTLYPVSPKRLDKQWEACQRELS